MNRCFRILPLLVFSFFFQIAKSQDRQVDARFKVVSVDGAAIPYASIEIFKPGDSLSLLAGQTDSTGSAAFLLQRDSSYRVEVSSVGWTSLVKQVIIKGDAPSFTLTLQPGGASLGGVVVRATRPLMRQEDDKTIVDPEPLASISTNALEIMEKTPGLFVDPDGNIYISSTTPAIVYINGREQRMSAADMATLLKNLPPNAIASIEIMRTPSSRFDASGSGGIVNVILRKGVRIGMTGSVNASINQGRYGNQQAGFSLNNNNGALSYNLNVQAGRRSSFDKINTDRFFGGDTVLQQDAYTVYGGQNLYLGFGLNYSLNPKWDLSFDTRLNYNWNRNRTDNLSQIVKTGNGAIVSSVPVQVRNNSSNYGISGGLGLKHKIDSAGSEWTTDLSFSHLPNETDQRFNTGNGDLQNRLQFYAIQTNYLKKLGGNITIETGLKTTGVRFRNNTDYFRFNGTAMVKDEVRTGAYRYREGIHAAYLQASKNFNGFILKAGSRLEHTDMRGAQLVPNDTFFTLRRTDLFPYVYLSKGLMKIAGYELRAYLVYRRTISRPAYEYLNPSQRFIDPFLFETGNPSLRPQFNQNFEANISVDERPLVAVGLNRTSDIFTQVVYPADTNNKVSYRTYDNLGSNKETYIRLLGAIPPGGKYFFVVSAQYNHNFYNGIYENSPLRFKRGSWTLFSFHTLKITPLTTASASGFVRFNGQQQFYELNTFGEARLSLTQQLLQRKLQLTLSVNDLFYTNRNGFVLQQGSLDVSGLRQSDTRRFGLNLRYNFGIRKKEESSPFNAELPRE